MNPDEIRDLAAEIRDAVFCTLPNSEGKRNMKHDWSDPYRGWQVRRWRGRIPYPYWGTYLKCVRCGFIVRRLRP